MKNGAGPGMKGLKMYGPGEGPRAEYKPSPADRPPDAALDPADVAFLGSEDRLRVVMDQRESLLAQVKKLETERDHLVARITDAWMLLDRQAENTDAREVALIGALKASRRTVHQLIVGCGSVIVILLAAMLAMWGNG